MSKTIGIAYPFLILFGCSELLNVIHFQPSEIRSSDSYAKYKHSLPTIEDFTLTFRIKILYSRFENVFISYAVSNISSNVIRIDYSTIYLRFFINEKLLAVRCQLLMRQWHLIVFVMNFKERNWSVFVDGKLKQKVFGDKTFSNVPSVLPGDGILILGQDQDLLGKGFQAGQSFCGLFTEFYIWNRTLETKYLQNKFDFAEEKEGMVMKWDSSLWAIHGDVSLIKQTRREISIRFPLTTKFVVPSRVTFKTAVTMCRNLKGKLAAPKSCEDSLDLFNLSKAYFDVCHTSSPIFLWIGYSDEDEEGVWRDVTTGEILPFQSTWGLNEPNGNILENCAAFFHDQRKGEWSDYSCRKKDILCFACEIKKAIELYLIGLSPYSRLDKEFTMSAMEDGKPIFYGKFSTKMYYNETLSGWVIYHVERKSIFGILENAVLPIGTNTWKFSNGVCHGEKDRQVLTLSVCNVSQFTCNDGSCVDSYKRCNQIIDCDDHSDENDCIILETPEGYRSEIVPPSLSIIKDSPFSSLTLEDMGEIFEQSNQPLDIKVSIEVETIPSINTVDMVFTVGFQMTVEWSDSRLIFYNLKTKSDLNVLSLKEKQMIWTPVIGFGYAIGDQKYHLNENVRAYAVKVGNPVQQRLKNDIMYNGSSVVISMTSKYDLTYFCNFDLILYPFDTQHCKMRFEIQSALIDKAKLIPKSVTYTGERQLIECIVGNVTLVELTDDNSSFSAVEVHLEFIRQSGFHLLTTFLPTSLMVIIAYLTFYFRFENFTDRIMVSLTSLLVLSSLQSQAAETLPKTSYFKMVDVWLFTCIVTIFVTIIVHTLSVYLHVNNSVCISKQSKIISDKDSSSVSRVPGLVLRFAKVTIPFSLMVFNIIYWLKACF